MKSRYADILAVERRIVDGTHATEVRVDEGGNDISTAEHVAAVGDDSCPIPGIDVASIIDAAGAGGTQAIGYTDPRNAAKTAPGEKRLYVRDEDGVLVAELWLKHDGFSLKAYSEDYPIEIETTGPVILNSPDVRVSDAAGSPIARVGDLVIGSVQALAPSGGGPITPVPPAVATPSGGVGFVGKIASGQPKAKA